jgi:2-dehydro-3-deoxygluconokinase
VYPKLITLGETMVVFDPTVDGPLRYVDQFRKRLGGAESNVAMGLARLGHSVGWISRVGEDELGKFLVSSIRGEGVDTSKVTYDPDAPTGLYIKERIREGNTQVHYYRNHSAASQLKKEHLDWEYIGKSKIIHLTGITPFLSENCLEVVYAIIDFAKKNNILLSFDPNLRFKLMKNWPNAKETVLNIAKQSDILMPGIDEAEYLLGTTDYEEIANYFFKNDVSKIAIKNGEKGVYYATKGGESGFIPSYKVEKVIDPVGAGDGFASGLLAGLLEEKSLKESVNLGAIIGAMVVTVRGDIEGLPERDAIQQFFENKTDVMR